MLKILIQCHAQFLEVPIGIYGRRNLDNIYIPVISDLSLLLGGQDEEIENHCIFQHFEKIF